MADEIDISNLRDGLTATNEQLEKLNGLMANAPDDVKKLLSDIALNAKNMTDSLNISNISLSSMKETVKSFNFKDPVNGLNNMKESLMGVMEAADLSERKLVTLAGGVVAFLAVASGKIGISDGLVEMSKGSVDATSQLSQVSAELLQMAPKSKALEDIIGRFGNKFQEAFKQMDNAKNMEVALLRQAVAAGDLNDVLGSMGGELDSLDSKALQYSAQMRDVATANGITFDSAVKAAGILRQIPGALDQVVLSGTSTTTQMNMLDATLKVAAGTFQDHGDVMKDVALLYENFNIVGTDSLEFVSRLQKAAQDLKMPMGIMRDFVHDTAKQFRFLGDNSQSAINVMSRFSGALKDSGVGPAALREIVSSYTNAVSGLDLAQRSFVAQQTGGAGGLQGGYQLSLDMKEGNMDKVASKVEETLRNMMGGQLVTLEEAAGDSRAAAQMARQVQMLTTGPLAVAKDEGQAFKILEAFEKSGIMSPEDMKAGMASPEQALSEAVNMGNDIQSRQLNSLNDIYNTLKHEGTAAAFALNESERILAGKDTAVGRRAADKKDEAGNRAVDVGVIKDSAIRSTNDEIKIVANAAAEAASSLIDKGKDVFSGKMPFMDIMTNLFNPKTGKENVPGATDAASLQDNINKKTAQEINNGATFISAKKQESRSDGSPSDGTSTVIIKVMGKDDVLSLIKLTIDNNNNKIIGNEDVTAAFGQPN